MLQPSEALKAARLEDPQERAAVPLRRKLKDLRVGLAVPESDPETTETKTEERRTETAERRTKTTKAKTVERRTKTAETEAQMFLNKTERVAQVKSRKKTHLKKVPARQKGKQGVTQRATDPRADRVVPGSATTKMSKRRHQTLLLHHLLPHKM